MARSDANVVPMESRRLPSRGRSRRWGKLEPLDAEELQSAVRLECDKAVEWISSMVSEPRQVAESYYEGKTRLQHEQGRSSVIVTVVRDTVKSVLTSIGRVFTQTDTIGEFSSDDAEDEEICKQMTLFVNGVFNKYGGYETLVEAATNALKSKIGVARVSLVRTEVNSPEMTRSVTQDDYEQLQEEIQGGEVLITEVSEPEVDPETGQMTQDVVMRRKPTFRNKWTLECLPPETFIVDANASDLDNARLVGVRKNLTIYEAMEDLGLKYDDLMSETMDDASMLQTERINRLGFDPQPYNEYATDPTNRRLLVTELWMRIDKDGDGVAELRHLVCIGINYRIVVDEPATCIPLAIFKADLQPNVFFPISLAEDMIQDQDAQTVMMRSILDNIGLVNNPRTLLNPKFVNLEDAKNNELGAIIRTSGAPAESIMELTTPFVAGETLPVLDYMRQIAESRSGVTRLSQGIDANALQSTSRIAANAAVQGSDSRIEMMVRNLAETGVKGLLTAILRVAMYEMKGQQQIKTPSGFKTIMPELWHDQVNININVGLGNGRIEEKQQILGQVIAAQQQVLQQMGPDNPFVQWNNIRNSFQTILRLAGIKNVTDYFPMVTPQQAAIFTQQQAQKAAEAAQAQNGQPGGVPDVVGAAKVKAEADVMTTQAKIQAQQQADIAKLQTQSQLKMAEMEQDGYKELMRLEAQTGSQERIAEMQADRARDADNQRFAVQAQQAQLGEQTKIAVAKENATNQLKLAKMKPRPASGR